MASEPIDCTNRPSMTSVQCHNGCGEWIVIDSAYTGPAHCTDCHLTLLNAPTIAVITDKPDHWFTAHNPPPTPPTPDRLPTPPAASTYNTETAIRGYCIHPHHPRKPAPVHLDTLNTDDITLAYRIHDHIHHNPTGWLIGGPGGANSDICNPCGGARWDKDEGRVVQLEQPRHDMCLRGRTRGRGNDCPCTHNRPHMRGIKPDSIDQPGAVTRLQQALAEHTPQPAAADTPPTYITRYLFDPEEENDD
jgi:hypothetical protein